ncbi:MAG TPA: asparagine synthase (glutamine-hydrolyzing) [Allosphingosinicella sp.]
MCGIFGALGETRGVDARREIAAAMAKVLRHRGPDSHGVFELEQGFIGANRLSIVDIEGGDQPMRRSLGGRGAVIVYNGEIYNLAELREMLVRKGLHPSTHCDTELVLLAYLAFGEACVERFDGQFAFAIWDEADRKLFLARDPAGIKPLFYAEVGKRFVFASEPKALFRHPDVACVPHVPAIAEYLLHGYAFASGYVTGKRSFYEGVTALAPGEILTIRDGTRTKRTYWSLPEQSNKECSPAEWGRAVREAMQRRIADYVSDEVPVGVALSGGVDSSIIAALAAEELTNRGREVIVSTISYAGGQPNDDCSHAEEVAKLLQSRNLRLRFDRSVLSAEDYLGELDKMLWHFDEPHWEIKQLAMFRNYAKLKQLGAKVVLTGEGADELFFGYYLKFPGFTNPRLSSADDLRAHWRARQGHVMSLFAPAMQAELGRTLDTLMEEAIDRYYSAAPSASPEKRMQAWYFRTFLHWLLTVNDRCSMAFSLEGRFPFLDRDVVDLAFAMPAELNTTGVGKTILREAFADVLPEAVVQRPKAPLPSPIDPAFHRVVGQAFDREVEREDDTALWNVLSRSAARELGGQYSHALNGLAGRDAEPLVSYLYLSQPLGLRTPQVFAHLTLQRWWRINFETGMGA